MSNIPILVCGDMNSTRASTVYDLLVGGTVDPKKDEKGQRPVPYISITEVRTFS